MQTGKEFVSLLAAQKKREVKHSAAPAESGLQHKNASTGLSESPLFFYDRKSVVAFSCLLCFSVLLFFGFSCTFPTDLR